MKRLIGSFKHVGLARTIVLGALITLGVTTAGWALQWRVAAVAERPVPIGALFLYQPRDPALDTPEDPIWREFWIAVDQPTRENSEVRSDVINWAALRPGMAIADVGAGGGYYAVRFAQAVGRSGAVWATDVDPRMVRKLAWERTHRRLFNLYPLRADHNTLGLPNAAFDLVTMVHVGIFNTCSRHTFEAHARQIAETLRVDGRWIIADSIQSPTTHGDPADGCHSAPAADIAAAAAPWFERTQLHEISFDNGWQGFVMMLHRK